MCEPFVCNTRWYVDGKARVFLLPGGWFLCLLLTLRVERDAWLRAVPSAPVRVLRWAGAASKRAVSWAQDRSCGLVCPPGETERLGICYWSHGMQTGKCSKCQVLGSWFGEESVRFCCKGISALFVRVRFHGMPCHGSQESEGAGGDV